MTGTTECSRCDGNGATRGRDGGIEVCACCNGSGELPETERDDEPEPDAVADGEGEAAVPMTPADGSSLTADQRKEVETRADRRRARRERQKRSLDSPGWS